MTSMFWGLRLEPGKRYTTTVDKSFHVSMAALDVASVQSENEILPVYLEEGYGGTPFILCNLNKKKSLQCSLDLNFLTGDRITFFSKGSGVVHLSGYIVPDEYNFDTDEEADEEDDEDDSLAIAGENGIKRKLKPTSRSAGMVKTKKGKMMDEYPTEDSEDDDDDDGEEDDDDEDGDNLLSSLNAEDDSDDSEDDDNEDDSEEEEESPAPKGKKNKKPNQQATPKQQAQNQKKQNGLTPKQGKKEGKKSETLNTSQKLNKSTEESSPQKKALEGGVLIKDLKVGSGPVCSKGKQAVVYYTGRLKSNNKIFDTTTNGPGFKFKVGKGDVIKAWDVGVVGMKVGGKRLITCPPNMAYGQKGAPPSIPGNSTLMFEVELKAVN